MPWLPHSNKALGSLSASKKEDWTCSRGKRSEKEEVKTGVCPARQKERGDDC